MNNKVINITLLLLIILFVSFRISTACSQINQENETAESENIEELPISFSGMTPCADCPGIEYYLHIEEDHFTELRFYRDRNPEPFVTTGSWFLQNDTLTIYNENEEVLNTFLFSEDRLTMLDREKQQVNGDLADMYILEKNHEESSIRRRHIQLRDDGIDFIASGNEPFWSVQIDFHGELKYRTPETDQTVPVPELRDEDDVKILQAELDSGSMVISIKNNFCRDTMSGFLFTHTVSVQFNGEREITGCGRYLNE